MGLLDLFKRRAPERHVSSERRLRELEIITARLVRAGIAGQVQAAFHGRGIEFSQVRLYNPGDDVRSIDWNVTARSGIPHVKEYVEERDLTVVLCLDVSGSMGFGSLDRRKADVASELVSVLAFAARMNGDRLGLLLFSDEIIDFIPPGRERSRAQQVVHRVLEATAVPRGRSDLARAVRFLEEVLKRRAVLVFLSDFLEIDPSALSRLRLRHDLIAMRITDPREETLPTRGIVRLEDLETGEVVEIDLARSDLHGVAEWRDQQLKRQFAHAGVDAVALSTAEPYERQIIDFFGRRRFSRRRA